MSAVRQIFDAHYVIGSGHQYCQDYAISGNNYVIVSDGCSGSPNTDIGARLLAHRAAHILKCYNDEVLSDTILLGNAIIKMARSAVDSLDIDPMCLDATLIIMHIVEDQLCIKAFGDGCIFVKLLDNEDPTLISIRYSPELPGYLSYTLSPSRKALYLAETPVKMIECFPDNIIKVEPLTPYSLKFPLSKVDYAAIFTDGVFSYYDDRISPLTVLPYKDKVADLTTFPNVITNGFLSRKLIRIEKLYKKDAIFHYDDLAIGAMKCLTSE